MHLVCTIPVYCSFLHSDTFFQARVKVDPDGNGAHIFAYTYNILKGRESGQFLHDFLWYDKFLMIN